MPNLRAKKLYPFLAIFLMGSALIACTIWNYFEDKKLILGQYRTLKAADTLEVAGRFEETFRDFYQGLRTIAVLPGVREINGGANKLPRDSRRAIQEVFKNTFLNVKLSEIDILSNTFDPDRIDPRTQRPEEPLLSLHQDLDHFDAHGNKAEIPKPDLDRLRLMSQHLKYLRERFPTTGSFEATKYPAVAGRLGPVNSDPTGVVYTVPVYEEKGRITGAASGVVHAHLIQDLLPKGRYMVTAGAHGLNITTEALAELTESKHHFEAGQSNPALAYSSIRTLDIVDKTSWELWAVAPQAEIASLKELKQAKTIAVGSVVACVLIMGLMSFIFYSHQRHIEIQELRAKIELDRAHVLTASIIESAMDSIVSMDSIGRIIEFNPSAVKTFGYNRDDVVGLDLADLILPEDQRLAFQLAFATALASTTDGSSARLIELESKTKSGRVLPVGISLSATMPGEDSVVTAFIRDMSEKRDREKVISQQRAIIADSERLSALGVMAGGIAHEVNNPVALIQSLARKIKREAAKWPEGTSCSELANHIESTALRIAKIVTGLRTISRDGSEDEFTPTSLRSIIEDSVGLCRERFKNHSVQLIVDELPDDLKVNCRSVQISQVFINLLNNSFDAIEDLDDKWVRISHEVDNEFAHVLVTDSGCGIPAEIAEKIMNPFFTTKSVGKGTGIGLSLSKSILQSHNGRFELDRTKPNTTFVVSLRLPEIEARGFKKVANG